MQTSCLVRASHPHSLQDFQQSQVLRNPALRRMTETKPQLEKHIYCTDCLAIWHESYFFCDGKPFSKVKHMLHVLAKLFFRHNRFEGIGADATGSVCPFPQKKRRAFPPIAVAGGELNNLDFFTIRHMRIAWTKRT